MNKFIVGSLCVVFTAASFAENIINTRTNTWKSVPITVDAEHNTYNTEKGFVMPEGNYYFTYSGYRCLKEKTEISGVHPVVLKDKNAAGTEIYCYPDH